MQTYSGFPDPGSSRLTALDTTSASYINGSLSSIPNIFQDSVSSTDTSDFYKFRIGASSSNPEVVRLRLDNLTDNASLILFNEAGSTLQTANVSGTTPELITRSLNSGVYYVRVGSVSGANTNYNLSLSANQITTNKTGDDTLAQAFSIGTLTNSYNTNDYVGNRGVILDDNDYYSFNIASNGTFSLTLDGLDGNANVELLNSSGRKIADSLQQDITPDSINTSLASGTYYVRVFPGAASSTNYNLQVSFNQDPADNAGNTLAEARDINTLTSTASIFTDYVNSVDNKDYYRFDLTSSALIDLKLTPEIANANVQLVNSSGGSIASSILTGTAIDTIRRSLNAGTYYIQVYSVSGAATNYELSVSVEAIGPDIAANTRATAKNIGTLNDSQNFNDFVGSIDANDYYSFNLSHKSTFNLTLSGLSDNADVDLLNSNGISLQSSTQTGNTTENINTTLAAGSYYLRIKSVNTAETFYNLNISPVPNDNAGNTLNEALQISFDSTGNSSSSDWVGNTDTNDYYRFSLSTTRSFNLSLNGLSANADVQLLDSTGNVIASSTQGGTAAESISRSLNANTYYIRVYPGESQVSTFYNLSIDNEDVVIVPGDSNQPNSASIGQLGTADDDSSYSVASDSAGNVYITGYTDGSLGGTNAGGQDAWLGKYNSSGTLLWIRQLGTAGDDLSYSVATDSVGNVYIAGETDNSLGGTNAGNQDVWLAKYDSGGTLLWTRQLGTTGDDSSYSVATDIAGNVYITGFTNGSLGGTNAGDDTYDAWLVKYDSSGTLLWTRQLGTTGDEFSYGVAVDGSDNIYITGYTNDSLGKTNTGGNTNDAWIAKYDSSGTLLWTRQLGTASDDSSYSVAVDNSGNVYITGDTNGELGGTNAGDDTYDAWLAKYNSSGTLLWTKQLGTAGDEFSYSVATDSTGNVYITGDTNGELGGTNAGGVDAWVGKYDSNGNQLLTTQLGTTHDDFSIGLTVDSAGKVYITGDTSGALQGGNAGGVDAWIAKYR